MYIPSLGCISPLSGWKSSRNVLFCFYIFRRLCGISSFPEWCSQWPSGQTISACFPFCRPYV